MEEKRKIACFFCKKRKVKCVGEPECEQCIARGIPCVRREANDKSSEQLGFEFLRQQITFLERTIEEYKSMSETYKKSVQMLNRLPSPALNTRHFITSKFGKFIEAFCVRYRLYFPGCDWEIDWDIMQEAWNLYHDKYFSLTHWTADVAYATKIFQCILVWRMGSYFIGSSDYVAFTRWSDALFKYLLFERGAMDVKENANDLLYCLKWLMTHYVYCEKILLGAMQTTTIMVITLMRNHKDSITQFNYHTSYITVMFAFTVANMNEYLNYSLKLLEKPDDLAIDISHRFLDILSLLRSDAEILPSVMDQIENDIDSLDIAHQKLPSHGITGSFVEVYILFARVQVHAKKKNQEGVEYYMEEIRRRILDSEEPRVFAETIKLDLYVYSQHAKEGVQECARLIEMMDLI